MVLEYYQRPIRQHLAGKHPSTYEKGFKELRWYRDSSVATLPVAYSATERHLVYTPKFEIKDT